MTLVSALAATLEVEQFTATFTPTPTITPVPSSTSTKTPLPSATPTNTPSATYTATLTRTPVPTRVVTYTPAPPTNTPVPTATVTPIPAQVIEPTTAPPTLVPQEGLPADGSSIRPETIIGAIILLGILGYVGLYLRGLASAERYAHGFVIDRCPVCRKGEFIVETRRERWFGVPRPRHIIRCTNCRSVLRETSRRRWRYAVDPLQNSILYERYNGREIDEETLRALAQQPPPAPPAAPRPPLTPPSFVDEEDQ